MGGGLHFTIVRGAIIRKTQKRLGTGRACERLGDEQIRGVAVNITDA
jgi:hypothetical protein